MPGRTSRSCPKGFSTTIARGRGQVGVVQPFHDGGEQERRDLEVEHGPLGTTDRRRDPGVRGIVGEVARHVRQPADEAVEHGVVDGLAGRLDRRACPLDELVERPVVAGDTDDRTVDQTPTFEPVQRPERHHPRQVAGDPEDHQRVARVVAHGCSCFSMSSARAPRTWPI